MKVMHLPAIYEGGLRGAVSSYMAAPPELYASSLWRCGRPWGGADNEEVFPLTLNLFNFSMPLLRRAWHGQMAADVVHHHGCWSLTSVAALLLKKRHDIPLVYSPHGAFIPASLQRYGAVKTMCRLLWENHVLKAVDCFHAVSEAEAAAIRAMAANKPIAVIPNGVDLATLPLMPRGADFWRRWHIPHGSFKVLFLSRLVPDKGVDLLLQAMQQVVRAMPQVHCIVAGDGPRVYKDKLFRMVQQLQIDGKISFIGPLAGEETLSAYRQADLFVLPSRNEAHPLVVMEALSQETPVLASRNTPYADLVDFGCGWWENNAPERLAEVILLAARMDGEQLRNMGKNGRMLLAERYSLARVHRQLAELYAWVAAGMPADHLPASVPIFHRQA